MFYHIIVGFLLFGLEIANRSNHQVEFQKNFHFSNGIIQTSDQTHLPIKQFCKKKLFENRSICGIGIISRHNKKCIQWKLSRYNNDKMVENTTFCKKSKYNPENYYCATAYEKWDLCQPIACKSTEKDDLCNDNITTTSLSTSIGIDFSHIQSHFKYGILIMSYSTTNSCIVAKTCGQCSSADALIEKHFNSCQLVHNKRNKSRLIIFKNFTQNSTRIFYLIPVINGNTIGSVTQLSLNTRIATPGSPVDVRIVSKGSTTIFIQWNQATEAVIYGRTDRYDIDLINQTIPHNRELFNTTRNDFMVQNLIPCRKYCITITAVNLAGKSAPSKIICSSTKAVFFDVKLLPVKYDPFPQRLVGWKYIDPFNCPIIFRLEYFVVGRDLKFNYITNNNNIYLVDLEMNCIYIVVVRPEFDGERGIVSSSITFHTGKVGPSVKKISINCIDLSCDISWEIDERERLDTISFILLLKNNKNKCAHFIQYKHRINSTFDQFDSIIQLLSIDTHQELLNDTQKCLQETIQYYIANDSKFDSHVQTIGILGHGTILIYSVSSTGVYEIGRKTFNHTNGITTTYLVLVVSLFVCISSLCIVACVIARKRHISMYNRTSLMEITTANKRDMHFSGPHMLQSNYRYSENYPSDQTFQHQFDHIQMKSDLMKQHKMGTTSEKLRNMNKIMDMFESMSPIIELR